MRRSLLFRKVACFSSILCSLACATPPPRKELPPQAIAPNTELTAFDELGKPRRLKINQVEADPEDAHGDLSLYEVSSWDERAKRWEEFCLPDSDGKNRAIPLAGTWDSRGRYHPDDKRITFACTSGVIAKCVRWGYKPWKSLGGRSLQDYHQACVHMTRADYCASGEPHTKSNTPINVYDDVGIQVKDPNDKMKFEAAWDANGAVYVNRSRFFETNQQILEECPDRLRGRVNLSEKPVSDQDVRQQGFKALLFNDSYARERRP